MLACRKMQDYNTVEMEMNLVTPHKIFSQVAQPDLAHDHQKITGDHRWLEFVHQISRLELANLPETKSNLDLLLQDQYDPQNRALIYAGISRYYKGIGNLQKTANALGHAYSLIKDIPAGDAHAYISIEMAILLSITGNIEYSQVLLEKIPELTESVALQKYAHFRRLENQMRLGRTDVIADLNVSLNYFRGVNDYTAVANHLKAIGNAYRRQQDFTSAMQYYISGVETALTHDYAHIATSIDHDIAMLYYHMGNTEEAITKLTEVAGNSTNHYVRCIALSNVGFIELKADRYDQALNSFSEALALATEHGTYHRITGLSYYMGLIHEEQGDIERSGFFHTQGFKAAMSMVENHFPCSGDTLRAIQGYHKFHEKHARFLLPESSSETRNWENLIDRSLKEARDLFQGALLAGAIEKFGSKRNAAKQLGISERSIFTVLERVKSAKQDASLELIQSFIHDHKNQSWKNINQAFETEFIAQVYERTDRNIKQLALDLDISYSSAAVKIKTLRKKMSEE